MKKITKAVALLLAFCMLFLCGCGETEPTEVTYSVSVVNAAGEGYSSGVIVQILRGEEQVAMKAVGTDGRVEAILAPGEYTVALKFTGEETAYHYDMTNLTLTKDQPDLEICLYERTVFDSNGETVAFPVKAGEVTLHLEDGKRNYFLFSADQAGTYEFTTSDPKATLGYYGYTSYIMDNSIGESNDGVMTLVIMKSMIGEDGKSAEMVIGVDADGIGECTLNIKRAGDPPYSIEEDEPWVIYEPTVELKKFTTPAGEIQYFDITAPTGTYDLVFNETDKTYHLDSADGPQVLIQLGKPTTYLDAISKMCTTASIGKYFFDADGTFVKRENYTKCLQIYSCTKVPVEGDRAQGAGKEVFLDPATGLYPLTEDLAYIIQNHGAYAGWWDDTDPGFIFQDADGNHLPGLNPDIAWLFLCCYVQQ